MTLDASCIDDPTSATGCAVGRESLDAARNTVFRIAFPPLKSYEFVGLNFQDPEMSVGTMRNGYDLRPATSVQFESRSPSRLTVQFGVGDCVSDFQTLTPTWQMITIPLETLAAPRDTSNACPPDITKTNILFTVVTNGAEAPDGGTILIDNIQFLPIPTRQKNDLNALSLPLANETVGVLANRRLPIPIDQVNASLATIRDAALSAIALLHAGGASNVYSALRIADAFDYALFHDNHGDFIPTAREAVTGCFAGLRAANQCALHSAFMSGGIAFLNDQVAPRLGQAGDVRLAGFSSGNALCGQSGFCLVLDGATGGDNALAVLALIAAYSESGDLRYFEDAVVIANWIQANLADDGGYGGYFVGYTSGGSPKGFITGKATTYNAEIFAAFSRLAEMEAVEGDNASSQQWRVRAEAAAAFVLQMYDSVTGSFYAGTIDASGPVFRAPGLCPELSLRKGNDVVNTCSSLDSFTIPILALAQTDAYAKSIDWTRPVQYILDHFSQTINAGGDVFSGFILAPEMNSSVGVAWEATSQAVLAMTVVGDVAGTSQFKNTANVYREQIEHAQVSAPFGDGRGLVAATLRDGNTIPPYQQCVSTPFECIAERVGLASTAWAMFQSSHTNPLATAFVITFKLRGRVTDSAGVGIGDVVVSMEIGGGRSTTTMTDSQGDFTFQGLRAGDRYHVSAFKADLDFVPAEYSGTAVEDVVSVDFQSEHRAFSVGGEIQYETGGPAEGVVVDVNGRTTTTGSDGRYAFTGLQSGASYGLTAAKVGYIVGPNYAGGQITNRDVTVDFTVYHATLSGWVLTSTDAPISGVTMTVTGSHAVTGVTGADGIFSIGEFLTTDTYTLTPSKAGYVFVPAQVSGTVANMSTFHFTGNGAFSIVGRVITADAAGVSDVVVTMTGPIPRTVTTDTNGGFLLKGLRPGDAYVVTPTKSGYVFGPPSGSGVISGDTAINFTATAVSVAPGITALSPDSGPLGGGTVVTISGANFIPPATVRFGTSLAETVFLSGGTIQAISPPGFGVVTVTVENPDGHVGSSPSVFTYIASPTNPSIQASVDTGRVTGTVNGLTQTDGLRVVVYAHTNFYYIQPCITEPTARIAPDGTWGPIDSHNGDIYALLVRESYSPPVLTASLPAVDGVSVLATTGPIGTISGSDVVRCLAQ